jgi:hypothetical protein
MARPWSEVVADPNFQALPPDAKENARNAYFQQNVLPNIPEGANASAIRLKFDQDTKPTVVAPQPQQDPSLLMAPVGGAEMMLKAGTGALASLPAGLAYGGAAIGKAFGADVNPAAVQNRVQQYLTYQPVSASGKAGEATLAALARPVVAPVVRAADKAATAVGKVSPTAETYLREAPAAFQAASGVIPLMGPAARGISALNDNLKTLATSSTGWKAAEQTPEDVLRQTYADTPQSMGAASAAPAISNIDPDLRQAISKAAQRTGGVINPDAFNRHVEASSLPVKVQLTEGQATRDPVLFSEEQNLRGRHTDLAEHFNDQNAKLVQNVQAIRDRVGPDVFTTNQVEHGDTLIDAYKAKDAATTKTIDAAYDAARAAVKDKTASVMDAPQLLADVTKNLHENLLFDSAPPDIMRTLNRLADNNTMSFGNIENMRTNLARLMRSPTADGNAKYAAGIIRDTLEQAPLTVEDAGVKSLFDQSRALARARFQSIEADPAYKAAVYETVPADKFVRKFVINGNRDDLATMAQNLAGDEPAKQTLSVAVLDHLRDSAGIGPDYKGSFKQSGYNRALQALDPKLQALVDPKTAEQLQTLGNVAHNIQVEPTGGTVNRSNTLTAGMSHYASNALEHAANAKAGGLPIGTAARKVIEQVKYGSRVRQAIQPGAGLDQLKPLTAYQQMLAAARQKAQQGITP